MGGKGVWRWGKRESIYTYRYTVTTRMTCIKMDSDDSHFNVSSIVRDKITRQCPQTKVFWRERRAEVDSNQGSSPYQPNALPLGQTCSRGTGMRSGSGADVSSGSWLLFLLLLEVGRPPPRERRKCSLIGGGSGSSPRVLRARAVGSTG